MLIILDGKDLHVFSKLLYNFSIINTLVIYDRKIIVDFFFGPHPLGYHYPFLSFNQPVCVLMVIPWVSVYSEGWKTMASGWSTPSSSLSPFKSK